MFQPHNFHPSDAIETLHAAILRVETIAQVASAAVDQLPCPSAPAQRRAFARMQILVAKAADEASAALAEGDQLIAALSRHIERRSDRHVERTRQDLDGAGEHVAGRPVLERDLVSRLAGSSKTTP